MTDTSRDRLLAQVAQHALDGVVVCDEQFRYVYVNDAACRIMGYPREALLGRNFLMNFPERMHRSMTEAFAAQLDGHVGVFTGTLLRPDGTESDMTWSNMGFTWDGARYGAAIFRESPPSRDGARAVADLAHAAASTAAGEEDVLSTLRSLADAGREHTRASVVSLDLVDDDLVIRRGGRAGAPPGYDAAQTAVSAAGGRIPYIDVWYAGRAVVLADAPTRLRQDPVFTPLCDALDALDWQTAVYVALAHRGKVLGGLAAYFPSGIPTPTEEELAYLTALADHAAIAVGHARLVQASRRTAALEQRAALARELHDSVSQALFSMTMHVRAAEKALGRLDPAHAEVPHVTKAREDLAALRELTTTALAEMRALIFELRPDALADEGLVAALTRQAAALAARTGLPVTVAGPSGGRLPLPVDTQEQLYRAALEAVNNAAKHAHASAVHVQITERDRGIHLLVTDDGTGFDPCALPPGHLGLRTMKERATAIGATFELASAPGHGTQVRLVTPVHPHPGGPGAADQ